MDAANLQRIYNESGRPGARTFRTEARRKGVQITQREAQQFVAQQSTSQVLQARLPSDGRVTSAREDSRWQLDLLDFSGRKKQPGGYVFVLTAIDLYSRYVWAEKLIPNGTDQKKTAAQTLTAYRKIIARNRNEHPKEVSTDLGKEFTGVFAAYLEDNGTAVRRKDKASINSIAGIDRAQQSIKKILANLQADSDAPWSSLMKKSVDIYNDREHGALYGAAPEDVDSNKELQYFLEAQAGKDIRHNNDRWRAKAGRLTDKGGFRVAKKREEWSRIDAPAFEGKMHQVSFLKGANVEDTDGNSFPVRTVLAVPGTSQDIDINDELTPASGKREQQLQGLRRFSEALKQELSRTVQGEMTLTRVQMFLKSRPQWDDFATLYKIPRAGREMAFLRVFKFQVSGRGAAITVRAPAGAPAGQRPAARAVQLAPRVPRRDLPGTQAILFQADNPKRGGSAAYTRWAVYRSATTVAEARRLGMTPQDLREALRQGHAQLD